VQDLHPLVALALLTLPARHAMIVLATDRSLGETA
jgi:hypothetical protein